MFVSLYANLRGTRLIFGIAGLPHEIRLKKICTCFHMNDLGVLKYFLRIEVACNQEGIYVCQRKTLDIYFKGWINWIKRAKLLMEHNHQLVRSTSPLLENVEQYRRLVGRLIYLAFTRPDLAYFVHILSQFLPEPRYDHWDDALHVVHYFRGCLSQGILLHSDCDLHLSGWCDLDWFSCLLTPRSLSDWLVFLCHSPISWKTKK